MGVLGIGEIGIGLLGIGETGMEVGGIGEIGIRFGRTGLCQCLFRINKRLKKMKTVETGIGFGE